LTLLAPSQLVRGGRNLGGLGLSRPEKQLRSLLTMLLLRDNAVLGLGVAGAAGAMADSGSNLFSFRGVAGGSACGECRCDGRRLASVVDSLGLAAAGDGGTLVRGRVSFVAAAGLHRGVTGAVGFTFTSKLPGFR
jgi:hypothetical protein